MFGIGGFELFIILVFGFLIFGPDKLPDIARTVGKGIARFREAQKEVNDAIGDEKIIDLDNPDEPFKDPIEALDRIAKRQEEKKAASSGEKAAPANPAKKGDAAPAAKAAGGDSEGEPKQESFTERKARYERERAARKAAEAEAAKKAAETPDPPSAIPTEAAPSAIPGEAPEGGEAEGSPAPPVQPAEAPAERGDA